MADNPAAGHSRIWSMPLRYLALLLPLAFVCACGADDDDGLLTVTPTLPTVPTDTTISYLALGDSYTIGTDVGEEDRWPVQLARLLAERERIGVEPLDFIARNGWRTDNLANGIAAAAPQRNYDLVSLLIGVNDQFQGFDPNGYGERFAGLLSTSLRLAGGDTSNVFVVSIPDYAFTPFGGGREDISRAIDRFNDTARKIAERNGVPFYSVTEISRRGLAEPVLVASDDLHPSGVQYRRWVEEVLLTQVAAQLRDRP